MFVEVCTPIVNWTALNCNVGTFCPGLFPSTSQSHKKYFEAKLNLHKKKLSHGISNFSDLMISVVCIATDESDLGAAEATNIVQF